MNEVYLLHHAVVTLLPSPTLRLGGHAAPQRTGGRCFLGVPHPWTFFGGMYIPSNSVGGPMKVQKIVSLTPETMRMAQQIPNFSGWIRRMLLLRDQGQDAVKIYRDLTSWVAAVNAIEDDEVRQKIYAQVQENKQQKRLGEFE
jgi:hypothetical protein